jgi:hypothetical protein
MGHVWLGFPEEHLQRLLAAAGFSPARITPLPVHRDANGPPLFAAVTTRADNH